MIHKKHIGHILQKEYIKVDVRSFAGSTKLVEKLLVGIERGTVKTILE